MSNKYFDSANNPNRAVPYEVARAEQINNTDDLIEQGMELVEKDIIRSIKLPEGTTTDQVITLNVSERSNGVIGFDSSGNITVLGGAVNERIGMTIGWDENGNFKLYGISALVDAAEAAAATAEQSAVEAAGYAEQLDGIVNPVSDSEVIATKTWSSEKIDGLFVETKSLASNAIALLETSINMKMRFFSSI